MSLKPEFKEEIQQYSLNFREADHVEQCIGDADVILVEPVVQPKSRDERGKQVSLAPANKITRELLATKAKSDAILLHSLPRMDEISPDVDITLVALSAGSIQRRRDAHGVAGAGVGGDGIAV